MEDLERYSDQALEKEHVWGPGDYFAHEAVLDIPTMLVVQGTTPFYVPDKAELLRYAHRPPYEELEQYQALFRYVKRHFGSSVAEQFSHDMYGAAGGKLTLDVFQEAPYDADIKLVTRERMEGLLQLVVDFANHIRLWQYWGHNRSEMGRGAVLSVNRLLSQDTRVSVNPISMGLAIVTVILWATLRNVPMAVLSAVLGVLTWYLLPYAIFRREDRILSRTFIAADRVACLLHQDERAVRTLARLFRVLQAVGFMLFGAAVWARFFG